MSNSARAESLQYGNQLLRSILSPLSFCLLGMTLTRFLLFFLSRSAFSIIPVTDTLMAFLTGFRFDLLILGFVMIPVVLAHTVFALTNFWPKHARRGLTIYLSLFWVIIAVYSTFEGLFFILQSRHGNVQDVWTAGIRLLTDANEILGFTTLALFLGIMIFVTLIGARGFLRAEAVPLEKNPSRQKKASVGELILRVFVPLFVVALAARGTVTAHHLERAHSQVSSWDIVNELALNSAWVFDKETQNR